MSWICRVPQDKTDHIRVVKPTCKPDGRIILRRQTIDVVVKSQPFFCILLKIKVCQYVQYWHKGFVHLFQLSEGQPLERIDGLDESQALRL